MVEAVEVLPREIQDRIEVRIWNVKALEGVKKKKELGAKVPSISMDGEVVFESGIPEQQELIDAILDRCNRPA
jgi:hypothetical protein